MKKIVSVLLCLMTFNAYAKGEINVQNDFSKDIIAPLEKTVNYQLKVLKNEKLIYNSSFIVNNSTIVPVFYAEDNGVTEGLKEKAKGYEQNSMSSISEASKTEKHSSFQLRVAVHLDKKTNTMWSNFFIQELIANKTDKAVTGNMKMNNKDVKGIALDSSPKTNKIEQELIIAHQNGNETNFSWHEYTFVFTGKTY